MRLVEALEYEDPTALMSKLLRDYLKTLIREGDRVEVARLNGENTRIYFKDKSGALTAQYSVVVWENVRPD